VAIVVARPCHNKLDASTLSRLIFASSRSLPSLRRAFSGLHSPSLEPSCLSSRQPHSLHSIHKAMPYVACSTKTPITKLSLNPQDPLLTYQTATSATHPYAPPW